MSRRTVVVSSTAKDLGPHRALVKDAILRQGLFPEMMEHLPAGSDGKIADSEKLVHAADLYVGLFAHRYGEVPPGHQISLTEMEYQWAYARGIPRLIFLVGDDHPPILEGANPDPEALRRLADLKRRICEDQFNVVNFFSSPQDLWGKVIHALTPHAHRDDDWGHEGAEIPRAPESYIAHRYLLMQSKSLIGRQRELAELTGWVSNPDDARSSDRVLSVVAVGGTGKSALTWSWFQDVAPRVMQPLAGRLWWSFYEQDAQFENFLPHALAYVSRQPLKTVAGLKPEEQMRQLIALLDREPFLVVLDGLERLLLAYNRLDAARLKDEELDAQTGNELTLPGAAAESMSSRRRLRKAVDERVGRFLKELAQVRQSRILISTRLSPADLQQDGVQDRKGASTLRLRGLEDRDALSLWKVCGGQVSDQVLSTLQRSGNHALAIQVLASAVATDPHAAGDFSRWCADHPAFRPGSLQLVQVKTHILEFALQGLSQSQVRALQIVAAFRAPTTFGTLAAILVQQHAVLPDELALHTVLKDLEDRGFVGWDPATRRYDLHPIVRSVVHEASRPQDRTETYSLIESHFAAYPRMTDREIQGLESLNPTLELFNALVNQSRFDDAHRLFFDRLATPLLRWLDAHRLRVQLLESLFPEGTCTLPRLSRSDDQAQTLNALSLAYRLSGQPGPAATMSRLDVTLLDREGKGHEDLGNGRGKLLGRALRNLALALTLTGELKDAEAAASRAVVVDRDSTDPYATYWEALDLSWLGWIIARTGRVDAAQRCLRRGLKIMAHHEKPLSRARFALISARIASWNGDGDLARRALAEAKALQTLAGDREKVDTGSPERESILIERLEAQFQLEEGAATAAEETLFRLLYQVRNFHLIHEEIDLRILLANLKRQQQQLDEADELLSEVWSWVEFGPYRLLHADARLAESRIHQSRGYTDAAVESARHSEQLAWCDGPGHWYHWGLVAARAQLAQLGIAASEFPPTGDTAPLMVDIDQPDQFSPENQAEFWA